MHEEFARRANRATAFRWITVLVLTLGVVGSQVGAASAARSRRKHAVRITVVENQISTTNPNPTGPPEIGSVTVRAGVVSQTPGGRGADVDHVTITGFSLATASAGFKGRVTFFLLNGTLSGRSVGRATRHADGSITFSGTTAYTGGTGIYRGVTGRLRFNGFSRDTPGSVTTLHLVGSAIY